MTAISSATNGAGTLNPKDRLAVARQLYLESVAAGSPMTGDDLAQHLGVTGRWGRKLIGRFKAEAEQPTCSGHTPAGRPGDREGIVRSPDTNGDCREALPTTQDGYLHPRTDALPRTAADTDDWPTNAGEPTPDHRGGRSWLDATIMLVVALVAAAASYGHMLEVAMLAGEPIWIARAFPITVDGLVLAAVRRGNDGRRWLALGAAVSVAANILAQFPEHATTVGPVVSAWPPIALYGTHRLLHGRNSRRER